MAALNPSSAAPIWRATATTSARNASARATRWTPWSPAWTRRARKVSLSIKAREVAEEKEAVEQYGSSDSGASLGDILGAALKKKAPSKKKSDE